jgi:pseudaminic acid cytidylyltransferase
MRIAIIPARGGSKRIPRKNIKLFAGIPMIGHAIQVAKNSNIFEKIIVSTEDNEIAGIAARWGAETPFIRPLSLADDFTPTVPVIAHAITECEKLGWKIDSACCIYPCVPFLQSADLLEAYSLLGERKDHYSFPVAEFPSNVLRALKRGDNSSLTPFFGQHELVRTQDLEMAFYDAGQFYWGLRDAWLNIPNIHSCGLGYVIPSWRLVDIDTNDDWKRAELMYEVLKRN